MRLFKLLLIGSLLGLTLLSSCSDSDKREAPYISRVFSGATARVTKDMKLIGEFATTDTHVFLKPVESLDQNADQREVEVSVKDVSMYELTFTVPEDFPIGKAQVKVTYNEKTAVATELIRIMAFEEVYIASVDKHTFGRWTQIGITGEFEPGDKFFLRNKKDEKQIIELKVNEFLDHRKEVKAEIDKMNEELVDREGEFILSVMSQNGLKQTYDFPDTIILQRLYAPKDK